MFARIHVLSIFAFVIASIPAAYSQNADFQKAERSFYALDKRKIYEIPLLLITTGHYNGMSTGEFNRRIFKGIQEFQLSNGFSATGILSPEQLLLLQKTGYGVMTPWGLSEVSHPLVSAQLYVPLKAAPQHTFTKRGLAFTNATESLSVDFSFFPLSDIAPSTLFSNLTTENQDRRISYKVMREGFFATAGTLRGKSFYSRFQIIPMGTVGFTVTWSPEFLYGERLGNLMSNLFFADPGNSTAAASQLAPSPNGTYANSPGQQVALAPPQPTSPPQPKTPSIFSGTGFFVTADGYALTNNHVVENCSSVLVRDRGLGQVVARDVKNDLAALKITTDKNVSFVFLRTTPVALGETIFALGYPLMGQLDNGLNFTNGLVSSLSGIGNDATELQFTAPIQPGNSGGPLVDKNGEAVGIATSKLSDITSLRQNGSVPQNVNFGKKIDMAANFLRANGINPLAQEKPAAIEATEIANQGRNYTLQIVCIGN